MLGIINPLQDEFYDHLFQSGIYVINDRYEGFIRRILPISSLEEVKFDGIRKEIDSIEKELQEVEDSVMHPINQALF